MGVLVVVDDPQKFAAVFQAFADAVLVCVLAVAVCAAFMQFCKPCCHMLLNAEGVSAPICGIPHWRCHCCQRWPRCACVMVPRVSALLKNSLLYFDTHSTHCGNVVHWNSCIMYCGCCCQNWAKLRARADWMPATACQNEDGDCHTDSADFCHCCHAEFHCDWHCDCQRDFQLDVSSLVDVDVELEVVEDDVGDWLRERSQLCHGFIGRNLLLLS